MQIQSVGASAEFGNVQGAVINVITRQGSDRFLYDASYYGQPAGLTGQPVKLPVPGTQAGEWLRARPISRLRPRISADLRIRDRLWFFGGYQHLRDYDSQPGTDPGPAASYEQNKMFAKAHLAPRAIAGSSMQSYHLERWTIPEQPTFTKPIETTPRTRMRTCRRSHSAHLTHTMSPKRCGMCGWAASTTTQESRPSNGDTAGRRAGPIAGNILSGGPPQFSDLALARTTGKGHPDALPCRCLRGDHAAGRWASRSSAASIALRPSSRPALRYVYNNGQPSQKM